MENNLDHSKKTVWQALGLVLIIVAIFLVVKIVGEIKGIGYIGKNPAQQNTITVSGKGEEFAVPDIAYLTFDVSEQAVSVSAAQDSVTKRMNDIIAFLKDSGIEEKDIKTINYNVYPRYEYERPVYPQYPSGQQKLVGYTVTHNIEVKIRKTEDAGKVLQSLGSMKVTNISGLSFIIENDEAIKAAARKEAIDDASAKAKVLARDLGVKLVRIVSFNENESMPYYFKGAELQAGRAADAVAPVPDVPVGENKIVKTVVITYEIH